MSRIIALEGISGSGKSSQVDFIKSLFESDILVIPELNQFSPLKEVILEWKKSQDFQRGLFFSEADILRLAKARAQTQRMKLSGLTTSNIIMDRSAYTSLVYEQGLVDASRIDEINRQEGVIFPDICFILDCRPELALSRINKRRLSEGIYNHSSVHETINELTKRRDMYLKLRGKYPNTYFIDSNKSPEETFQQIRRVLRVQR